MRRTLELKDEELTQLKTDHIKNIAQHQAEKAREIETI